MQSWMILFDSGTSINRVLAFAKEFSLKVEMILVNECKGVNRDKWFPISVIEVT